MNENEQNPLELVPAEPGTTSLRNREDPTLYVRARAYRDSLAAGKVAAVIGAILSIGFLALLAWGGVATFKSRPDALAILLAVFGFPSLGLIVHILGKDNSNIHQEKL